MSRSISPGQKRHLKSICSQVVEGLDDLEFDAVKQFFDEGVGVRLVKEGLNSLFRTYIRPVASPAPPISGVQVWTPDKVIQVGTVKDEQAMRKTLKAASRQIDSCASDILPQVRYSPYMPEGPRDVKLVFVSNEDLGLTDEWIPLKATHAAGLRQGLELCEWEDGPQLAAQYTDQPYRTILRMAMKPIVDSYGHSSLFVVAYDGSGLWLRARCGGPDALYYRSFRFVFRRK